MSFSALLDDLARERDRRERERNLALLTERIRIGGKQFHKAMSVLTAKATAMVKSMHSDLAQTRAAQRQDAIDTLADINARATEMASTGKLTGEEGAKLDLAIARAAERIREL